MGHKVAELIDFWRCCFFTLEILVTVLPAFLLAGAVIAFVPPQLVLKRLSSRSRPLRAYGGAALAGYILSICSCNIVPLFIGIMRKGAGLGPAITLLYAGPAVNILSVILVFKVVGPWMGVVRALVVPVAAILVGIAMSAIFKERSERSPQPSISVEAASLSPSPPRRAVFTVFFLLLLLLCLGGIEAISLKHRLVGGGAILGALLFVALRLMSPEDAKEWGAQTLHLMRMVIPILVPAILGIALLAHFLPIRWVTGLFGKNNLLSAFNASLFGSLMYFPMLTEAAFVKALLKEAMLIAPGPALSILLTAPGLSLAGMVIVWRELGTLRLLLYWLLIVAFSTLAGWVFGVVVGIYLCPCMLPSFK